MAQTTLNERKVTQIAVVERVGEKILIPESMSIDSAVQELMRFKQAQEQVVVLERTYDAFPWDGAYALNQVLIEKFGYANLTSTFFSNAQLRTIEIDFGKTTQVPWGTFQLPNIEGSVETGVSSKHNRMCFNITVNAKRKCEPAVKELFDAVGEYLRNHSIYTGKAFSLDFDELDANGLVEPRFLKVDDVDERQLILNRKVHNAVWVNIFTPIMFRDALKKIGAKFKRGILMAGKFGVGKTLCAKIAAKLCTKNGITFVQVPKASQLAEALSFVRGRHEPSVLHGEDIDRAASGERTVEMDELLNIIDGIDSKSTEIMVLLSTNAVEKINKALLRSERMDMIIDMQLPDADTVERLLRYYGRNIVPESEDLKDVAKVLEGNLPATVAGVVANAKLAALWIANGEAGEVSIDSEALLQTAESMQMQLDLLSEEKPAEVVPTIDAAFRGMVASAVGTDDGKLVFANEVYKFKTSAANGHSTIKMLPKD